MTTVFIAEAFMQVEIYVDVVHLGLHKNIVELFV